MTPPPARFLDHVGILVADADEAAARFLVLGLRVVHDELVEHVGARLVYLAGSDDRFPATIQLVEPARAGPLRDHLTSHGEGPHHVCLAVGDLGEVLASLPEEEGGTPFTGGRGRRACFLSAQAASTLVELVEIGPAHPGHPQETS